MRTAQVFKSKIFKISLSLILAFLISLFLAEKVFIHGTLILAPRVRWSIASFPSRARLATLDILRKLSKLPSFPKVGPEKPIISPSAGQPTPTAPPYKPLPSPKASPTVPSPSPTTPPLVLTPTPTRVPSVTIAQFAQCLTSRGMKMYGSLYCGACAQQRNMFGEVFSYIIEVDCTKRNQLCQEKGIWGYPTWEDGAGNLYPGVQSFSSLSQISGYPAPS